MIHEDVPGAVLISARRRPPLLLAGTLLGTAALGVASMLSHRPLLLVNTTPSEPIGLYLASPASLRAGALIAFQAPPAAFPYADARLGYLHRRPMLKTVSAVPGDLVCTDFGRLAINGHDRGPISTTDSRGAALPRWRACRRLGPGEAFAFSDRVPNSFDSRYFGPVSTRTILGVYRPLLALGDRR